MTGEKHHRAGGPPEKSGTATARAGMGGARQRRVLIWFALALVIVLPVAALLLWFYALPTQLGTQQALAFLNRQLARASNLRLTSDSVSPSWNGVTLTQVRLEAKRNDQWYLLLRSPEIEVGVSLLDVVLGQAQTFVVETRDPILTLYYDDQGDAVLPVLRSSKKAGEGGGETEKAGARRDGLRVNLENVEFRIARPHKTLVWWEGGTLRADALPANEGYDIEIIEGGGFLPQLGLVVRELHGRGSFSQAGLFVRDLSVETDAGSVEAAGSLVDQQLDAQLSAEQWPWEFFAEILEQPGVDVPGTVELIGRVSGTLKNPVVETELSGFWRDEAFRASLSGEFTDPGVRLGRAHLEWGRTTVDGSGRFQLDGTWSLAAEVRFLDLAQVSRLAPHIALPASELGGPVRIEGEQGVLHVHHDSLGGVFADIPIQKISGEWTVDRGQVDWIGTGVVAGGIVQGEGIWDGSELLLRGRGQDVRLSELRRLHPALERLQDGSSRVEIEVSGPIGALQLDGRGSMRSLEWREFGAENLRFSARGRLGGNRDSLHVILRADDLHAAEMPFDSLSARGTWESGRLRIPGLHLARADTSVAVSMIAETTDEGWLISASGLRLRAGETALVSDGAIVVAFESGGVDFRSFKLRGNAGRCEFEGWVRGREADLRVATEQLDLGMLVGPLLGVPIAGRVDCQARLVTGEERMRLLIEAAAPSFEYGEAQVESLVATVVMAREADVVTIEKFELQSNSGQLSVSGSGTLAEDEPLDEAQWWTPLGRPEAWRGRMRAERLNLSVISQVLPGERELEGFLTASVDLAGPGTARQGECNGQVTGLAWNGYRLDRVEWQTHYGDGRLKLEPVSCAVGDDAVRLIGELPLRLAWGEPPEEWFPEEPMDVRIELPSATLSRLPLFLSLLAAAEGKVAADIRLGGTPRKPELHGTLAIQEAGIRVTGREEIYTNLRADVALEGERIVIRDIVAEQGSDGSLRGTGSYQLFGENAGSYRLNMRAENALAAASGEYAVSFDGDFVITDGPRVPGVVIAIPHIQGDVEVRSGVILYDFGDPENVVYLTGPRQAPMYIYDLKLDAPSRVYWRTPSANIELEANLNMTRSLTDLKIWGRLKSVRGTYFFLENKFTVDNGELIFDQAESMNPKINASAVTRVTRAMGQSQYEKEEVHIELTGRIQKPAMRLWSSSGLAQTDIVALLTVGRFGIGADDYTSGDQRLLVGVTGTQYLVRQLAREVPELSVLLADIDVGTTVGGGSSGERIYTTVGLSRYFTPDLLLRYSQVVGGSGGTTADELNLWEVSAEYRIGRLFYLTGERVDRRVTSSLGSGTPEHEVQYNLDVRARLEY
jgi:hypothetical protein